MHLSKGANAPIDGNLITLSWAKEIEGAEIDVSAYLLNASRKVEGDAGMVFYGQKTVPGLSLKTASTAASFQLTPEAIPASIDTIAICIVIDNTQAVSRRLSDTGSISMRMGSLVFDIDLAGATEQALIVAEVYRRNGAFKIRAVGQGFDGGLGPLATSFGVDVEGEQEETTTISPLAVSRPEPAPAPVSLTKVTLEKAQKVSLRKNAGAIRAKLEWEGRGNGDGDLDLYCFYVLKDGTCGKVYWKDLGHQYAAPFVTLSGDSQKAGEEEIILHRPEELRYALFAAYSAIANGAGSFKSYRPRMIFTDQAGNEVVVPLLNPVSTSYWVAITHLDIGQQIVIGHVERYGKGGLSFIAAERAPRLHPDGSWDVSKGEIEFKR